MKSETPDNSRFAPGKPLDDSLVAELEQLAFFIRQQVCQKSENEVETALVRVVPGLAPEDWARFASTHGLTQWMAFALDREVSSCVNHFLDGYEKLAFQSEHDALTGIGNRRHFNRQLQKEVDRALRSEAELTLIFIDLDGLKFVNDTYGHPCGDVVLKTLAEILKSSVRHYDIASRIGGDEFAVILPASSCWTGMVIAGRLLEEFRQTTFSCDGVQFSLSFSVGVSSLSLLDGACTPEALLKSADSAMYEAKTKGKNSVIMANRGKMSRTLRSLVHSEEKQLLFSGKDAE
jgi:diguanylate cyclase (GGDEF)-like protein